MSVFVEFFITLVVSLACGVIVYFASFYLGNTARIKEFAQRQHTDRSRWFDSIFGLLFCAYTLVFVALSILRHLSTNSGYDLAQYDQIVWNSLHGRLFEQTYITDAPVFLGKSFTPILLALVPLYAIWPNPIVLLVLQTIALSIVTFPLYWLARKKAGDLVALCIVLAYFLSPVVERVNLTDFHEIVLAAPLLAFATWFLLRQHYAGFFVCLGLALLVKEEIAFVAIMFGVYLFLFQRRRWLGLLLTVSSAILALVLLQYVIPSFIGTDTFYYFGQTGRYAYLGNSLSEVVTTILTKPTLVAQHLLVPAKFEFLLHLLVPLALVPLAGVEIALLALPTLGYSLLSDYYPQFSIKYPYTPPLLPFLFLAAVLGVARLLAGNWRFWILSRANSLPKVERRARLFSLAMIIVVASGMSYRLHGPAPFARDFAPEDYIVTPNVSKGRALAGLIPRDAIVVAIGEWVAQLSQRQSIYNVEDFTVFRRADYLFFEEGRNWYYGRQVTLNEWIASGTFETVNRTDGFIIAKRKPAEIPLQVRFDDRLTLTGCTIMPKDDLRGGIAIHPILFWGAQKGIPNNYEFVVRVVDDRGHEWAEDTHVPDNGFSPVNQLEIGKPVADFYNLKLPPTLPAGDYLVSVSAKRTGGPDDLEAHDENGEALGSAVTVATVKIAKNKDSFTASQLVQMQPLTALFVDMGEIRFLGYVPPPNVIHPGELLSVGLYWRARAKPQGDYVVAVQLRDETGQTPFEQAARPANNTYPTTQWDTGEVLLDWHDFVIPENLATGEYGISVVLRDNVGMRVLGEVQIASISIVR